MTALRPVHGGEFPRRRHLTGRRARLFQPNACGALREPVFPATIAAYTVIAGTVGMAAGAGTETGIEFPAALARCKAVVALKSEHTVGTPAVGTTTRPERVDLERVVPARSLRRPTLTRVEAEPPISEAFGLRVSPPFPNPFTDQTTIRYELSEAMVARIVVYDALGREVAVLADGEQPAGSYEVVFNGADLAPGTYVVRFEAAGEERAFTMIKLR
ncbi:MAG: T9SS type A sorting domain-containing protein [Bacteroidetes bacterium]|nr:T9SS type A sorting domain-containing protein [Bacteroidota bacterium]